MKWLSQIRRKLARLLNRHRFDLDLEEEMQSHLEFQAADNQENGMAAGEARNAARRLFGNATLLKEESREMWGWGSVERLGQDLKYAIRMLRKNRAFTAVALLTLAIGIGANTVIFTVVHAVLLAPLPYREPDRLAAIGSHGGRGYMSAPDAADLRAQSTLFEGIATFGSSQADLAGPGEPEQVRGSLITANLFSVLGVAPALGRVLKAADDQPSAAPAIVIGYALWQRRFGGDAAAIGKTITVGKLSRTIVGVVPPGFHFPSRQTEYWFPMVSESVSRNRGASMFQVVGRLKPGVEWSQAGAEAKTIVARLAKGRTVDVAPLMETTVGGVRSALLILTGAVGLVLLVACANVANLLLSRGLQKRHEMAVRVALGAGRTRLVRLLFGESLVLSLAGGSLGVALAAWGVHALRPFYPDVLPRSTEIRLSMPVLGFTMLLSCATALLTGIIPAMRISRTDVNQALKSGLRSRGLRTGPARSVLVVAQVAMAMVLLTCAGLLVRSFLLRTRVSGFDPSGVLAVEIARVPPARLSAVLESVRALPGVVAAGSAASPVGAPSMGTQVHIGNGGEWVDTKIDIATPGYFGALRVPVRMGRAIDEHDIASATPAVVINEAFARRYYPGEDALGKQIRDGLGDPKSMSRTIVGVVGDLPPFTGDREPEPEVFLPFLQAKPDSWTAPGRMVVRTAVPPEDVAPAVRRRIRSLEPNTPIVRMETVEEALAQLVASPRFYMLLLGLFAMLALALAALGVYGVVSFRVSLQTHEIGVRMALGATAGDVLRTVIREGFLLAAVGAAIGSAASFAATRLLVSTSLLFRVGPADPLTFAVVPVVLLGAAMVACWAPARRATQVDPAVALRYE
jgi:predicted permease